MPKKYNLALTPVTKGGEIVTFSQKFSNIADKYLLGKSSLPHVTLYQFDAEEKEIDTIWEGVRRVWEEKPVELEFNKFSCISFDNIIYWVSLLPRDCSALHEMHGIIARILGLPPKKNFDPHMTLINTKDKTYEKEVDKSRPSYVPITDTFVLTLGLSDEIGQLTEVVHRYEVEHRVALRV